ncbi:fibrinogen-like protein A isoform X1 [Apostichopus japonicus]|uniref:fibrinogen-like protein A isoform X1 n=1 Tax=Stichopus japonicus TaxID=307972 RepID=UPI003AB1C4CD
MMTFTILMVVVATGIFGNIALGLDDKEIITPNAPYQCPLTSQPVMYRDCSEMQAECHSQASGVYQIQPEGYGAFKVYCDFDTDEGGWTVFQRRLDGSVNFDKLWTDYKNGFGFLNTEFWLGNEKLAYLTAQKNYELRIDFRNKHGDPYYASYDHFRVGDSGNYYHLLLGVYSGNSGNDALDYHRNMSFSTSDADHDPATWNCAASNKGGWWFNACDTSNLNGRYGVEEDAGAVEWTGMPGGSYALKFTEMKIRP